MKGLKIGSISLMEKSHIDSFRQSVASSRYYSMQNGRERIDLNDARHLFYNYTSGRWL